MKPAFDDARPVLVGRALTKIYRMGEVDVHALRGVDIALYAGELMVLIGASGSGKSTLLNILGGLDTPTSGQVFYGDQELSGADAYHYCRRLLRDEAVGEGGEQQRVAIARAIAKQPDILLCDEPTGALDYQTGVRVLEILEQINRELGTTTPVITHNAPVSAMADRVITLHDGQLAGVVHNAVRVPAKDIRW